MGSDRSGSGERRESGAETDQAHVLFATDVGWPQSFGVATQSDGKHVLRDEFPIRSEDFKKNVYLTQ